ncbi:hypothetical protein A3A76_01925 [Candidatus Woesebacteria bacterium RIFCSPLOWO2_01_FULL_39_23]|uniref:M23ase beta-sheet core domain-containing protein n=1 Tax=Candidatus Woesebacteria bacterium RIFCSPHIGHO2_01_FULL_40_22 TaxID=1802499 RepID=A0A1F7YIK3_9BACT|nr:MAG: hypothetical protein A2141_05225 [Candidatus Woesebacteria bacterium RBG_16_40_11]OGM26355.1 MAG: hypothetical protein A2628_03270 [Candidatus Woesebacteria bacterium RIFCSPHIGHO2_01_FULL_40_22]OGM37603.1 MAG: hypothetical protein A3E41_05245 [Candidatus Woesebacteria bacterium RIFCSPHIGHO2_12_FULL_38_9]OGM61898.1 MAG: hypothetical protein A3A76_01925 [Candidatus Woesebacteria bacterium RIFCSPLOWO2_01_FULL_39_23]
MEGKEGYFKILSSKLKDRFAPPRETVNEYLFPLPNGSFKPNWDTPPSHSGPFKQAIDLLTPLGTPVLAPLDGVVVKVVDGNDKYGETEEFANFLNYITIQHANGEFSQPAHLAKDSALVKVGDRVTTGQQIAITGNSGWMTEPHLHFIVFKATNSDSGFTGLKIKFKK